jgi:hypothetical protein
MWCGQIPESRKRAMPRGNPNPNPETRFKKGESGNPGGKTAEQIAIERRNADRAMRLREKALVALEAVLDGKSDTEIAGIMLDAQALRLLKDAEDRGLGSPVQDVKHSVDEDLAAWLGKS